uniref:Uncharacterized protein n=1 Tax=Rhizophora mucronata TaxID=61149 RepID=A0A2P2PN62_RHIMU
MADCIANMATCSIRHTDNFQMGND